MYSLEIMPRNVNPELTLPRQIHQTSNLFRRWFSLPETPSPKRRNRRPLCRIFWERILTKTEVYDCNIIVFILHHSKERLTENPIENRKL